MDFFISVSLHCTYINLSEHLHKLKQATATSSNIKSRAAAHLMRQQIKVSSSPSQLVFFRAGSLPDSILHV